jgi:hypothetical protein
VLTFSYNRLVQITTDQYSSQASGYGKDIIRPDGFLARDLQFAAVAAAVEVAATASAEAAAAASAASSTSSSSVCSMIRSGVGRSIALSESLVGDFEQ